MRRLLCVLLFGCSLAAQSSTLNKTDQQGTFYVDGVVYQYVTAPNCTVVGAAHSSLNHKFLALKVRIYNAGAHSITVKPEDIIVEDVVAGRVVEAVPGAELAHRMRKTYNMARFAVGGVAGGESDGPITRDMAMSPEFLIMMRAMAARANGGPTPPAGNVLYTDTPGALADDDVDVAPAPPVCDQICRLRNRETQGNDVLGQLQRGSSADLVENASFRANTIPPGGNVVGVLYYPLGKLAESAAAGEHGKKGRLVRVTVPVVGEKFQFELGVE